MRNSWSQGITKGTATAALSRFVLVSALLAVGGLAMVNSVSSSAVGSGSGFERGEGAIDRVHYRGEGRARGATLRAHEASAFLAPVVGSINVDRTDDAPGASACTAAPNDCSLRGAIAFANGSPGTTINVPAGTYNLTISGAGEGFSGDNSVGDLDITGDNTSIVGAGAASTIIAQTSAGDRVIEVNPFLDASFNTSISNVTISGGTETTGVGGGGIISGSINNSLTLTSCVISGNSATGAGTFGGGGVSHAGGSLTITGCTISNNSTSGSGGGVGYSAGDPLGRFPSTGTLAVSGSTFGSNSAGSLAAGGGGLDLFDFNLSSGVYNVDSSSFSSNSATNANGGAITVESGGPLTVTTSSFSSNTAANSGGAIQSSGSDVSVTYSRLVGNSVPIATNGRTFFRSSGNFTADDNWWGSNSGPSLNDFRTSTGSILPATFLKLRISASPDEICPGASSTLTADIKERNIGAPLTTELNGLPAFPVPGTTIFNNAVLGTLSGASTQFVAGAASATYTAGGTSGMGSADATADNQTVTATISIQANATTDPADQAVCQGDTANFSTTASGPGPYSYAWTLDGSPFNGDSASINVPTGALSVGPHIVAVTTTAGCGSASQSATLTVQAPTATSDPADLTICNGATANFSTTASGTGPFHYAWTVDGLPFNGDSSSISVPTGSLSSGPHTIAVTTTGTCGSASQTATLTVGEPPVITLSTNDIRLWPPNHAYHTFNVSDFVATASGCDGDLTSSVVIASVSSDEVENNPSGGDGNTLNDIVIAANCKSVQLRAERDSSLNGRVYTITFRVTDSHGNTTTATATVSVPVSAGSGSAINGPGPGYTVTSACP
jgi:predicted outer membrane repeat protein